MVDSLSQRLPNSQLYAQVTVSQATTFIRPPLITAISGGSPTEAVTLEIGVLRVDPTPLQSRFAVKHLSDNDLRLSLASRRRARRGALSRRRLPRTHRAMLGDVGRVGETAMGRDRLSQLSDRRVRIGATVASSRVTKARAVKTGRKFDRFVHKVLLRRWKYRLRQL